MTLRPLLLIITIALALPAAAAAQNNPFGPLPPASPPDTPTQTASSSGSDDNRGLDTWQQALIFGAGIILLGGIGTAIVRDARHRAPVTDDRRIVAPPDPDAPVRKGTRPPRERVKERRRETAKRARAQRKRNR